MNLTAIPGPPFIVYPAIDLRGGKVVRLLQGRADQQTVYADHPAAMARQWEDQDAPYLHVVDLDGAFSGTPPGTVNRFTLHSFASAATTASSGPTRNGNFDPLLRYRY